MACYICGKEEDENTKMHKVISDTEIVDVCEDCASQSSLPKIRKVSEKEVENSTKLKQENWRDRVNKQISQKQSFKMANSTGLTLRDVVERKMNPSLSEKIKPKTDLIKNFNWEILKARRQMKFTQMRLGTLVGESEFSIRMLERGVVPENYHPLIKKLEETLRVKLFTEEYRKTIAPALDLTVGDLQEVNSEEAKAEPYWRRMMHKIFSKKEKTDNTLEVSNEEVSLEEDSLEDSNSTPQQRAKIEETKEKIKKKELSPEEINSIIFGSKK